MSPTMCTIIPMDANLLKISDIEYDFENYALNYGIPETLDPLPYRKAGSVFAATGDETESVLTSAKHDPRLRTVVCRHWLRDLCMKGAACEFLHQFDLSKMPLCRHGERCKIRDCPFRHISEENRMECAFYKSGFCIHGPFCRYKHVKRLREDLPIVADFTLGLTQMQAGGGSAAIAGTGGGGNNIGIGIGIDKDNNNNNNMASTKRIPPKPNEFYKISLCKHFAAGDCPFGVTCHFAHGEAELRKYPRNADGSTSNNTDNNNIINNSIPTDEYNDNIFPDTVMTAMDYFTTSTSMNRSDITSLLQVDTSLETNYVLIVAASQEDLAVSTVRNEWYVCQSDAEKLNTIYYNTTAGTTRQVILLFTVAYSRHIQGFAIMEQTATYQQNVNEIQENINNTNSNSSDTDMNETSTDDVNKSNKTGFTYRVGIRWCCMTEYPLKAASELGTQSDVILSIPTPEENCVTIPSKFGNVLKKVLLTLPTLPLYESWNDNSSSSSSSDTIPSIDHLLTDFRAPGGLRREVPDTGTGSVAATPMLPDDSDSFYGTIHDTLSREVSWPTMPGPGYIFGCSSDTMDECLGRGIFGLPANMKTAASFIVKPGTTIFLYNVTDRLLFGIFEAASSVKMNIEPTAFSKNPNATSSPFPIQIRVRVSLECPPIDDSDPILNDILRTRIRGRIGPLSHAQTVAIASLFANQCGALRYMKRYRSSRKRGIATVQAPPISLPPRIVKQKDSTTNELTTRSTTESIATTLQSGTGSKSDVTSNNIVDDNNNSDIALEEMDEKTSRNYDDNDKNNNMKLDDNKSSRQGLSSNITVDDMLL